MFGEETIKMTADAFDKRLAKRKERDAAERSGGGWGLIGCRNWQKSRL
jgi:hypothetical protein